MNDSQPSVHDLPVVEVSVDLLSFGFSPRTAGHDEQNVRILAELDSPWPPLLVHQQSYRVIDGVHRLLAARLRGDKTIAVRLHECDEAEAFVLAVRLNVTHGLPLSLSDRKLAAARIIGSRPEWSDRRVALAAGLSDKTVAAIRRTRPVSDGERDDVRRIGGDGRSRPVDAAARRSAIARLLVENPDSSLRQIAVRAGVSPETVRSVRSGLGDRSLAEARVDAEARGASAEARQFLQLLVGDPALRSTDAGRLLLRILNTQAVLGENGSSLVEAIPEHDLPAFRRLALANSEAWRALAQLAATETARRHAEDERAEALV